MTVMEKNPIQDGFFRMTSRFTQLFPERGAKILDALFLPLLSNSMVIRHFHGQNQKKLRCIKSFDRLLVISDIHIGDSVLALSALSAVRDFFPGAQIDYVVKKSVAGFFQGHPDVSGVWPIFTGSQFPNQRDLLEIQELAGEYDMVFNFCPFLEPRLFPEPGKVFHALSHAPIFARNEREGAIPNHIAYQVHRFIYDLLSPLFPIRRGRPFEGPRVYLSAESIEEAGAFFMDRSGWAGEPVLFLNPDTASPFTRIPLAYQAELLNRLLEMPCRILIGEGHTEKGIGEKLFFSVPMLLRSKITLVPSSMPLETYTALIDWSDVFISGDTGPLHLAAAAKRDKSGKTLLRNRTSVFSVFGATPPRISGYAARPGYLDSAQDAPAYVYQSGSSCRNVTCMHKMAKMCDAAGCFQSLDLGRILSDIRQRLQQLAPPTEKAAV